jgi:hypothetical protein
MPKLFYFSLKQVLVAVAASSITACSPHYNWREVRGTDAPFAVLLPAKPASHTRSVNLSGIPLTMTMTAAQVNGVTFAVGSARLPDEATPETALTAMKTALVNNIGGKIRREKTSPVAGSATHSIDIEAVGAAGNKTKQSRILFARFAEKNRRIYQAVVVGPEQAVSRDAVETFLTSLKLD